MSQILGARQAWPTAGRPVALAGESLALVALKRVAFGLWAIYAHSQPSMEKLAPALHAAGTMGGMAEHSIAIWSDYI